MGEYGRIRERLREGRLRDAVFGLTATQAAFLLASLLEREGRPLLVVTPTHEEAREMAEGINFWTQSRKVALFPGREVIPYPVAARSPEVPGQRLAVLASLITGEIRGVVAPASSLLRLLPPPGEFREAGLELRPGKEMDPLEAARILAWSGYQRVDLVEARGQFALRGSILDVFPLPASSPVRVEFLDQEVESCRLFDPVSQRSREEVDRVFVPPAGERGRLPPGREEELRKKVEEEVAETARHLERQGLRGGAQELRKRLDSPLDPEIYLPLLYPPAWLGDYFPERPILAFWDFHRVKAELVREERVWEERVASFLEGGRILPSQAGLVRKAAEVEERSRSFPRLYLGSLVHRLPEEILPLHLTGKQVPSFRSQIPLLQDEVAHWQRQGYRVALAFTRPERAEVLLRELRGHLLLLEGLLPRGFSFPAAGLVVVTEEEIFGRRARPTAKPELAPAGAEGYADLEVGDYVVHVDHGIGQYLGIKTLEIQGVQRDYLFIRYEGADRLYVPVDQIHLVQKYLGGEGARPKLSRLGSGEWARVKRRVRESVRRLTRELLEIYAARKSLPGHAFSPDTPWQREFEEEFPYEETPDQLQALREIKADMEKPEPMDRLLCGDVGFGKTEVAMRAAFKAVMDKKQVAVLVPTTVLAQQHLLTFRERFKRFPVNIQALSRFQSASEQEEVITGLRRGTVDIVIGTHRLLQPDVSFRDLGLLIIDEEHRFGVAHKEALRKLKATVDVLSMTATPIPRTLHMALSGFKDMSVIETPPEDRLPVETYVVEYDERMVAEAIRRELERQGQVFYVHNRVRTIGGAHRRLARLVPEARIAMAHGQMPEEKLERVMMEFLEGKHQVLLCTSIIESGLDMPNVNTLIVEDSDRFGLAQLYQLRGRVGRSPRLAYAYFTYRPDRLLSEAAQKRLEAIKDFTALGSGFRVALRDLEIRGTGNIMGAEQHGFIASVGFELWSHLLEEAVRELRGEKPAVSVEPQVEVAVDAYILESYIPDARSRIQVYRRLRRAGRIQEVKALEEELRDRYGPLPPPVENLFSLARIRILGREAGVLAILQERDTIRLALPASLRSLASSSNGLKSSYGRRLAFYLHPHPEVRLRLEEKPPLEEVEAFLARLRERAGAQGGGLSSA